MKKVKFKILTKLNNEKGSLLLVAYFVIVVFLGIGSAFLMLSTSESRVSERQRLTTVAFHVAEAGLERALYDLRQDFVNASGTPSWADGDINGFAIGPNTNSFYNIPYTGNTINGGTYAVQLQNVLGDEHIWIQSVGTAGDVSHTLQVYVRMVNLSPWDNAIFAGAGAAGVMVNGNVDIRGSVHILGSGLNPGDFAIDLGGTSELVGNNYAGLDAALVAKVPPLPTTVFNGENVETLNAELRVKKGLIGLSGSATVGEADVSGNSVKETVNGSYVTDGFAGNQGSTAVHSDNGYSNAYDLGDAVQFPSLTTTAYQGYSSYKDYLENSGAAYVVTNAADKVALANITPNSVFDIGDGTRYIRMDGSGNMEVSGIVYIDSDGTNPGDFNMSKAGSDTTISYTGQGTILAEGNVQLNANLVTTGNNSFPTNIMGVMTPNQIGFNEASIDVMGIFYAENQVVVQKQTDIMGTIVSNYFDMGTNVPSIFQVPDVANSLPPGMIGSDVYWYMVVGWLKI